VVVSALGELVAGGSTTASLWALLLPELRSTLTECHPSREVVSGLGLLVRTAGWEVKGLVEDLLKEGPKTDNPAVPVFVGEVVAQTSSRGEILGELEKIILGNAEPIFELEVVGNIGARVSLHDRPKDLAQILRRQRLSLSCLA
jgi:hypothetical protein